MTATEIVDKTGQLTTEIAALQQKWNAANSSYLQWKQQHDSKSCSSGTKKKKAECNADKAWKYERYTYWLNERNRLQTQINNKNAEIKSLNSELESQQLVNEQLATQGLTAEAVITRTRGDVEASNLRAAAQAQAEIESARVDNEGKKNFLYLGLAAAAIILIVISIVVYRKYIKRKKAKS